MFSLPEQKGIDVYRLDLDAGEPDLDTLLHQLSPDERDRAHRFHFDVHRGRFISARGQLRLILGAILGVAGSQIEFRYGAHGKPSVDGLEFNLSHSGPAGILAIVRDHPIGVDIEQIRPIEELDRLAATCFSPDELRDLGSLPAPRRPEAFYQGWTRKEATLKAIGSGLHAPLDRFSVDLTADGFAPVRFQDAAPDPLPWMTIPLPVPHQYAAALAIRGSDWVIHHRQ